MGDKTQNTTQVQSNEPWGPAQGLLKQSLSGAQALDKAGIGDQVYKGLTAVPYAPQTTQGMNAIQGNAAANIGGQGLSGQAQDIVGAGGFAPGQQESMNYLQGAGTNPFDPSQNNAYQGYRNSQLNDVADRVAGYASSAGRYGSDAFADTLATSLSDAGTSMDMQQFGRMDSLNSQRAALGQQGFQNLGAAYDLGNMPAQDLMTVGGMYEDLSGRQLNDKIRIFQETQNKPWEQLARMNAIGSGAGQFGTSTSTAQQPGRNPFLSGLGYASSGLGALGSLF